MYIISQSKPAAEALPRDVMDAAIKAVAEPPEDCDYGGQLLNWVFASPEGRADRVRAALALDAVSPAAEDPAAFIAALRALDVPAGAR